MVMGRIELRSTTLTPQGFLKFSNFLYPFLYPFDSSQVEKGTNFSTLWTASDPKRSFLLKTMRLNALVKTL